MIGTYQRSGALLCAVSPLVGAAPALETLNYARFYTADDSNVFYSCANDNGAQCNGSVVAPGTNWIVNYFAQGTAGFGLLRDQASVFLSGDGALGAFPAGESTGARSGYRDTYTITGGQGAGTIDFSFAVTGVRSSTNGAFARALFQYVPIINGQEDFSQQKNYGVVNDVVTIPVDFTFDVPIEFTVYLYALAQVIDWQPGAAASADYFHTATLSKIDVFDSQNQELADFKLSSASGTSYTETGILPEPGTWLLMLASLLGWFVVSRHALFGRRDRT